MCGICGVVDLAQTVPIAEPALLRMRDTMVHRGPDDAGHLLAPGVALGSRRLAILDLSPRGHMPMQTDDGRYTIVYNGEVYNFRGLRPALEAKGYSFHSDCDTEVLLKLYVAEGPAMLSRLNGMFAFAIWDSLERTLFIARDRLGIKPLYYAIDGTKLYFASEEKALFAAGVPARFDARRWEELLCFRYISGEQTPFEGVKRLLPGHYLTWKNGQVAIQRWWNLADRARAARAAQPTDALAWFRETFDDSVNMRRISDVPIGVLLSGGLDSSSVAASLGTQGASGLGAFTMRFTEGGYDEGPLAMQVAERWGLNFFQRTLPTDELVDRQRRASWFNDEPLVHGNDAHLWTISEYAKPHVTVLLSGEGSDELMGGYVRYQPLRFAHLLKVGSKLPWRWIQSLGFHGRAAKLARFLGLGSLDRMILYNACDTLPSELSSVGLKLAGDYPYRQQVLDEARALYPGEPMRQAMYSDQHTFLCSLLDRNDRMTMAASIECRVPFLDYRLVEGIAGMPSSVLLAGRRGKHLLRASIGSRLPESVLNYRKWGFGVPWSKYLREVPEIREILEGLPQLDIVGGGQFDVRKLRDSIGQFLAGDDRHQMLFRQMVLIAIWHQSYFGTLRSAPSDSPR